MREEIELAKAEVTGKFSKLTKGAVVGGRGGRLPRLRHHDVLPHARLVRSNDLFNWDPWTGFPVVTVLLFLLRGWPRSWQSRLFKKGAPPTPDLAIEEAKRTRAELEAQKISATRWAGPWSEARR